MVETPAERHSVLIDEALFVEQDGELRLRGAGCDACGTTIFPVQSTCSRCGGTTGAVVLADRGAVWTWTTQEYPLKEPYIGPHTDEEFESFALGYVELPDGVRVETVFDMPSGRQPQIGEEMELTLVPIGSDVEGRILTTFAFRPVSAPTT